MEETLLQGDDVLNPTDDDGLEIPLPSYEEVKVAIIRFKSNEAAGSVGLRIRCNDLVGVCFSLLIKYGQRKPVQRLERKRKLYNIAPTAEV